MKSFIIWVMLMNIVVRVLFCKVFIVGVWVVWVVVLLRLM